MSAEAPRGVIVHPGDGSWGSDKVLLQTAEVLAANFDRPLALWVQEPRVELSFEQAFPGSVTRVRTLIARRRDMTSWKAWRYVCLPLFVALDAFRLRKVDRFFVNTCVPLSALLAARLSGTSGWVHVHEIPHGQLEQQVFAGVVAFSGLSPVYISHATKVAFAESLGGRLAARLEGPVVHNGLPEPVAIEPSDRVSAGRKPLRLLCLGRFAAWKGQAVLLEALSDLDRDGIAYEVRVAGYDDNVDPELFATLEALAAAAQGSVELLPYQDDVEELYRWSDVVVVPSIRPEPFGLAAIEAGLRDRAVIGARHGGLVEIIDDNVTGVLVEPGSPAALAVALRDYADRPDLALAHGAAAKSSYPERFGAEAFARRMHDALFA